MLDPEAHLGRVAIAIAAVSVSLCAVAPRDVEACGGFFSRGASKPSLAYEQALILYDPSAGEEHFVREVAFRGGQSPFGFVVPTPTQPVVAKVEKSPFQALRAAFPFEIAAPGTGFGSGHGALGGGGGGGAGVTVLSVAKVGSFTAFVLAADDVKGLASWLAGNGLTSTPEADAWLAHYVRMKFYYVAMRYDPPAQAGSHKVDASVRSETIRISFPTPALYYPYFEPRRPPLPAGESVPARLLELWVVSPARVTPISARTVDGKMSWVSPMLEGGAGALDPRPAQEARMALNGALAGELATLLPPVPLVVQTFQDQKYSREGYGDILFAPRETAPLTPANAEKLRPLLGILDPALVPEMGAKP